MKRRVEEKAQPQTGRPRYRPAFRDASQLGRLTRAHSDERYINLNFEKHWSEKPASFPHLWFRDLCQCTHCVSESSGQKRFATCDIDDNPAVQSCRVLDGGAALEIVWADDFMSRGAEHTSVLPLDLLHRLFTNEKIPESYSPQRFLWDRATIQQDMHARTISYADWMAGGPPFAAALLALAQWGLVLVKGVPSSRDAVEAIANQIGALQATFYGRTWDVVSKPRAENVAYTNEFLCLHQDLMYWSPPPKVQLLHCLANDCDGGDSLFSDGLRAAAEFRLRRPDEYRALSAEPVLFHYARNGNYYARTRTVIDDADADADDALDEGGAADGPSLLPRRIHWAPPFQGPFPPAAAAAADGGGEEAHLPHLRAWNRAARAFRGSLEAEPNMLRCRLEAGDCVLFDNHRVLHGRTRFEVDAAGRGQRHLHGAYLDEQTLRSALTRVVKEGLVHLGEDGEEARAGEAEQAGSMYR